MSRFKNSFEALNPKPEHGEFIVGTTRKFDVKAIKKDDGAMWIATRLRVSSVAAILSVGVCLATPAWADSFFFSTGNPDGKLGATSRPAGSQGLENGNSG